MVAEDNSLRRVPLHQISPNQNVKGCAVLLDHKEIYVRSVEEGYADEVCLDCDNYFAPYKHFVRCDRQYCPMKDGKSSMLDQMCAQLKAES